MIMECNQLNLTWPLIISCSGEIGTCLLIQDWNPILVYSWGWLYSMLKTQIREIREVLPNLPGELKWVQTSGCPIKSALNYKPVCFPLFNQWVVACISEQAAPAPVYRDIQHSTSGPSAEV